MVFIESNITVGRNKNHGGFVKGPVTSPVMQNYEFLAPYPLLGYFSGHII